MKFFPILALQKIIQGSVLCPMTHFKVFYSTTLYCTEQRESVQNILKAFQFIYLHIDKDNYFYNISYITQKMPYLATAKILENYFLKKQDNKKIYSQVFRLYQYSIEEKWEDKFTVH